MGWVHVGMMDDLFMEVDKKRKTASDPVVVLFADGNVH